MSPCSSELPESESLDDEELEDEDDEELDLLGRWMCISGIDSDEELSELSEDEELPLDDEEPLDIESMSSFDEDALPLSRCGGGPPCLSGA